MTSNPQNQKNGVGQFGAGPFGGSHQVRPLNGTIVEAHGGALHTAKTLLVQLGWETDSQSSEKLKREVAKPGAVGPDLGGGGCAPGNAHVGAVQCTCFLKAERSGKNHCRARGGRNSGRSCCQQVAV